MKKTTNDHFRAADAMAALLPNIHTYRMKHEQQRAILRELIAGLKYGLPPTKNCGSLRLSA